MSATPPRALLFDLGGVVIDIDFERAIDAWRPLSCGSRGSREAMVDALRSGVRFEEHERGEIEDAAFFRHVAATLALDGDETHIASGWNDIFIGPIDETLALVRVARERVPCFAFTNTNPAHHGVWSRRFPQVVDAFERVFVSYEMGLRKPDRDAFDHVVREIGVEPPAITFFDDAQKNVDGARAAGLDAVLVRSPADVADALRRLSIVT